MAVENRAKRKKNILFVCCGNRERSLIAERRVFQSLEEHYPELLDKVEIGSAGIFPKSYIEHARKMGVTFVAPYFGKSPNIYAIKYLTEKGTDVSSYRSRGLNKKMVINADLILPMDRLLRDEILQIYPESSGKVFTFKEFAFGPHRSDLDIGDSMKFPDIDKKTEIWIWPDEYPASFTGDIEQCVSISMDKFVAFIKGTKTQ